MLTGILRADSPCSGGTDHGNETDDDQTLEDGRGAAVHLRRVNVVTLGSHDLGVTSPVMLSA